MALSPARMWTLFRAVRVLVYSIATLMSMGIAGIYALLIIRGWDSFNGDQRAIVIVLLVIYALSTVITYLMLILRFRLWLDGTRLAILVFAQVGGSVTFDVFYPSLPCNNLGSESTCKMVETIAIFGGWALSGLLSIFALYLAVMHYVPVPTRRPNPEAILALQLANDEKREKTFKRASTNSALSTGSDYSQKLHITPYTYSPSPEMMKSRRSPSIRYVVGSPVNQYRPRTPGSMHSSSASSHSTTSSSHTLRPAPTPFDYNRPATPGSLLSANSRATIGSHITQPAPIYNYDQSGAPSLRSAETETTLGSHSNRLAVHSYTRDHAGTPVSVRSGETAATLDSHVDGPTATYVYSHSRGQESSGSGKPGASHSPHNARIPPFEHYRAPTPAMSIRSVALTATSSIRTAPRQRYNQNNGIPAPRPLFAQDGNFPPLTQAFREPISRNGTPMSSLSDTSFYTNRLPAQRSLAVVGPGYSFPQPPTTNYRNASPISPTATLPFEDESRQPSTPMPIRRQAQLREAIMRSPSPSVYSGRSIDSMLPSPSIVPRSPSPETSLFHSLPTTPQAAVLPARPDLSPAIYTGRYGTPVPDGQRSRLGSVPEINVNDLPVLSNQHYRTGSDCQGRELPRKWTVSPPQQQTDGASPVDQWRQNLAYTPRPTG
ncbi:hypothetical protein BDN70DRAFT_246157 [Pholiota conissans]|uniref:Uncharacterized protein n=1 Tax=Pholiota conissans TaxID=109636 RepID=A0A9P6CXB1_9AGAR|nr:hypothetical protein BDN70DRAFT_246157 [Pholiota conissans]